MDDCEIAGWPLERYNDIAHCAVCTVCDVND